VLLWGQESVFGDGDFHAVTGEREETVTVDTIDGRIKEVD
jgi:hypothetical protein